MVRPRDLDLCQTASRWNPCHEVDHRYSRFADTLAALCQDRPFFTHYKYSFLSFCDWSANKVGLQC
jgi:hypothetical protein